MGVPLLSNFVKRNPVLLNTSTLRDCRLVIDGSNLFHFLYHNFEPRVNQLYGGDYDTFSEHIKKFFDQMSNSNIRPFVVIDGGYEPDDRKFEALKGGLKEIVTRVVIVSQGNATPAHKIPQVAPILAKKTFIHTLDSLEIPHVTCEGEADEEIAALANHWNCPVLSNDSDFFIFPLSGGFILLSSLQYKDKGDMSSIECNIFHQSNLIRCATFRDPNLLFLLASLQGNDYVVPGTFDPFFKNIIKQEYPNYHGVPFIDPHFIERSVTRDRQGKVIDVVYLKFTNKRINRIIKWLAGQDTFDVAVDAILGYFKRNEQANVEHMIWTSVETYVTFKSTIVSELEGGDPCTLMSYTEKRLPKWFYDLLKKGKISNKLLDAVRLHRVLNKSQVENTTEPSAYQCALPLRKIIYGVLFSLEDLPEDNPSTVDDAKEREKVVEEYERDGHTIKHTGVVPDCAFGIGKIRFENVASLEERRRFVLLSITENDVETMQRELEKIGDDSDIVLPLLAVIYWIKNADNIKALHVIVMVACIFRFLGKQNTFSAEFSSNLDRLYRPQKHNKKNKFDCDRVHAFAQYQTCFQALLHLNSLLLFPFKDISPSFVFNGTLIYNLYEELQSIDDPVLSIPELLGRSTKADRNTFERLYLFVKNQIPRKYHHLKRHQVQESEDQY